MSLITRNRSFNRDPTGGASAGASRYVLSPTFVPSLRDVCPNVFPDGSRLNDANLTSLLSAIVVFLVAVTPVHAHPIPQATAGFELQSGNFHLTITCDVAAFVMQTEPGHLGEQLAQDLREMPAEEIQSRIASARDGFRMQLVIAMDGNRTSTTQIKFPDPETIRPATAHGEGTSLPRITVQGDLPDGAKELIVSFPPDLGQVLLTVTRTDGVQQRESIGPGQSSAPFHLLSQAESQTVETSGRSFFWPIAIAASFALLVLAILFRRRPH